MIFFIIVYDSEPGISFHRLQKVRTPAVQGFSGKSLGVYGLKANFNHRFGDAEDYASLMVRYPEAVSILEGTWNTVSSGYDSGPIVWGEKGALIVENVSTAVVDI